MPKNIIYLNYLNPFYKNELNINNDLNKKYYASQRDYAKIFNEISEIFEKIFISVGPNIAATRPPERTIEMALALNSFSQLSVAANL